nr:hypothetical protein CFP56_71038 [Quercus suber]
MRAPLFIGSGAESINGMSASSGYAATRHRDGQHSYNGWSRIRKSADDEWPLTGIWQWQSSVFKSGTHPRTDFTPKLKQTETERREYMTGCTFQQWQRQRRLRLAIDRSRAMPTRVYIRTGAKSSRRGGQRGPWESLTTCCNFEARLKSINGVGVHGQKPVRDVTWMNPQWWRCPQLPCVKLKLERTSLYRICNVTEVLALLGAQHIQAALIVNIADHRRQWMECGNSLNHPLVFSTHARDAAHSGHVGAGILTATYRVGQGVDRWGSTQSAVSSLVNRLDELCVAGQQGSGGKKGDTGRSTGGSAGHSSAARYRVYRIDPIVDQGGLKGSGCRLAARVTDSSVSLPSVITSAPRRIDRV